MSEFDCGGLPCSCRSNTIAAWMGLTVVPILTLFKELPCPSHDSLAPPADWSFLSCLWSFIAVESGCPSGSATGYQSRAAQLVDQLRVAGNGIALRRELGRREHIGVTSRRQDREDAVATRWKARVRLAKYREERQTRQCDAGG